MTMRYGNSSWNILEQFASRLCASTSWFWVTFHCMYSRTQLGSIHTTSLLLKNSWPSVEESNQNPYFHRGSLDTRHKKRTVSMYQACAIPPMLEKSKSNTTPSACDCCFSLAPFSVFHFYVALHFGVPRRCRG